MSIPLSLFVSRSRVLVRAWTERTGLPVEAEWGEELARSYWLANSARTTEERTEALSRVGEFARRLPHELVQQITGDPLVKGKEDR